MKRITTPLELEVDGAASPVRRQDDDRDLQFAARDKGLPAATPAGEGFVVANT